MPIWQCSLSTANHWVVVLLLHVEAVTGKFWSGFGERAKTQGVQMRLRQKDAPR